MSNLYKEDLFSNSVAKLVSYYWQDESKHFESEGEPIEHIFHSVRTLSDAHPVTLEKVIDDESLRCHGHDGDALRDAILKVLGYGSEDEAENFNDLYGNLLSVDADPIDVPAGQIMATGPLFEHIYHHIVYLSEEMDKIELASRINNLGRAIEEGDQQQIADHWVFHVKPMIRCNHSHTQQKAPKP